MKKTDVIEFFDLLAKDWDKTADKDPKKIKRILDVASVAQDTVVLDVACGTGILIPDYLDRKVRKCIAVDISPQMIEIAKSKYRGVENVSFLCADAETLKTEEKVDSIVIYNAFPHFVDRDLVFKNLSECLNSGGRLTVAHGMGREALILHHAGRAEAVSTILPEKDEMKELMQPYFEVDVAVSEGDIYIVSGKVKR